MKNTLLIFLMLTVITAQSIVAGPLKTNILAPRQLHNTILISDKEMLNIVGGDWVDAACALIGGAGAGVGIRAGYVAFTVGARAAAALVTPGVGIFFTGAAIYCWFHQ